MTGGGYTFIDAAGELKSGATSIGTLDYARGTVTFGAGTPSFSGNIAVTFRPAGAPVRVADTAAIAIYPENRGYSYTITLSPMPKPGSLIVSYMSQGKWYDLRDNGSGAIKGTDSSFGVGSLNYTTGSVILTTGALPDASSTILFSWGTAVSYFNRSATPVPAPSIRCLVAHPGIVPGTLTISWTDGANTRTITDNSHGAFTGYATGTVRYAAGEIFFRPTTLPAGGAVFSIHYEWGPPLETTFIHPLRNPDGTITVTLPQTDIRPNSVELEFNLLIEVYPPLSLTPMEMQLFPRKVDPLKIARDTGTGVFDSGVTGSINYTTGVITFTPDLTVNIPYPRYTCVLVGFNVFSRDQVPVYRNTFRGFDYLPAAASMPIDESGLVKIRYRAADVPNSATESVTLSQLEIDLTDQYAENIVSGSVRFTLGGKVYGDRLGILFTDIDPNTGAGTQAGTLDYSSGKTQIKVWQPGAANVVTPLSLLTELGGQPVDEAVFRVPAAPVRTGSLQIRATPLTGGQVSATANMDGSIATADMFGSVDYMTGVVRVRFGHMVNAAGNEAQIWYNSDAVVGGQIFKPKPVFADTIRFNAVAYTYMPLSADILGLDPVRLPSDGRVPIYRPGDVAVVHHTAIAPFSNHSLAGDQLDVGRVRLSSLRVLDADGKVFPADRYTANLDTGIVTLNTPLSLAGFTEPLSAEHRIEDMALISDVQINGSLALTRPITHDYPAQTSRVSSALIIGDLQARAHTLFAQQTWTGEWKDSRIGANTIAQYNETVFPIDVTNRGAIEERWAMIFTNTTEFRVIGDSVGQIAMGNTSSNFSPTNPETSAPYFVIKAGGWGQGWSAGNVLRFNTAAANYPLWVARTVLQGPTTQINDSFQIQVRGDIDR